MAGAEALSRRKARDGSSHEQAAGGLAEIVAVLAERTPIYESCAQLTVDTEGKTPGEVALEIMACLNLPSCAELA